ncbi:MAG: hypothetical protein EHM58_14945 [Ignavibacteriae bacterium]|nr:MAG: hypothetical protein EHM58_14945 [Ignavibacteriota bacterium]
MNIINLYLAFLKNLLLLLLAVLIIGCSSGPKDDEVIKAIYNQYFSPQNAGLQLLLNIQILSTDSPQKQGDTKLFPVNAKINFIQGALEMGYTGQGPGKYAQEYEVEVIRVLMFYKDNNGNWKISGFHDTNRKEFEKVWRPGTQSMKNFYKDKIILNTDNFEK